MEEVDAVVYYEDPVLKFDRVWHRPRRGGVSREHQAASLATLVAQKLSVPATFGSCSVNGGGLHPTVPHHLPMRRVRSFRVLIRPRRSCRWTASGVGFDHVGSWAGSPAHH